MLVLDCIHRGAARLDYLLPWHTWGGCVVCWCQCYLESPQSTPEFYWASFEIIFCRRYILSNTCCRNFWLVECNFEVVFLMITVLYASGGEVLGIAFCSHCTHITWIFCTLLSFTVLIRVSILSVRPLLHLQAENYNGAAGELVGYKFKTFTKICIWLNWAFLLA